MKIFTELSWLAGLFFFFSGSDELYGFVLLLALGQKEPQLVWGKRDTHTQISTKSEIHGRKKRATLAD
jgi:hypothetical protein